MKKEIIPTDNNIIKVPLEEAMPDNYIPYAVEVAKERALPDVRDGLKPVHRRILYGAYMLKALPDKPYLKSARIVGDILGKYHPHGDTSVYDAMVILAQNFSTRAPLIDGHGNFGSIDGDAAAAMRYTEARLSKLSLEMLKDIEKDVVDMVNNYSDTELEPKVLPSRFPNMLVNGAFGIAVGLATNIPPHNLSEVCDGLLKYIDNNDIEIQELLKYIKGPDLPTGGLIIGKESIYNAYKTGEGKVVLRAKTSIEKLENGRYAIIISEFPFRKNKAKLLENISNMTVERVHSKILEDIFDIRDESDRTGIRGVIEFKKSTEYETVEKVLKYLFKKTDLQCNIIFNMVALCNGKPETLNLKEILVHYINHQKDVVRRRTKRELEECENRFHIVEGFIKAIGIMDELLAIIRGSKSKKDAEENIISKYDFTKIQAIAILELMLYRLTGLELKTFEKEHKELLALIKKLRKIYEDEGELLKVIKKEIIEVKEKYGDARRSEIILSDDDHKIESEEIMVEEDIVVTLSEQGFIKSIPLKTYNRINFSEEDIDYREGDKLKFLFNTNTKNNVGFITSKGEMCLIKGINIPTYKWKDKGERISYIVKGISESDNIVNIINLNEANDKHIVIFTNMGGIKKIDLKSLKTNYYKLQLLKLKEDEEVIKVYIFGEEKSEDFLKVYTNYNLEFTIKEPNIPFEERNTVPQRFINLKKGHEIKDIEYVEEMGFFEYNLNIGNKGNIDSNEANKKYKLKIKTNSNENILFFMDNGICSVLPSSMLSNIHKSIHISKFIDGVNEKNAILNAYSLNDLKEGDEVITLTSKGIIKKTSISEFNEDVKMQYYKFKNDSEKIIDIFLIHNDDDKVVIVTKRGFAIKFFLNSLNLSSKNSSGVTAISLKDEDEVIGGIIEKEGMNITLKSNKANEKTIMLNDIRVQNRGGRGQNIFLVVLDEFITSMKIK